MPNIDYITTGYSYIDRFVYLSIIENQSIITVYIQLARSIVIYSIWLFASKRSHRLPYCIYNFWWSAAKIQRKFHLSKCDTSACRATALIEINYAKQLIKLNSPAADRPKEKKKKAHKKNLIYLHKLQIDRNTESTYIPIPINRASIKRSKWIYKAKQRIKKQLNYNTFFLPFVKYIYVYVYRFVSIRGRAW